MRRILWMMILFGTYIWVMTSGHDQIVLETSRWAYNYVVDWFEDAEVDFQVKKETSRKKIRTRRWD